MNNTEKSIFTTAATFEEAELIIDFLLEHNIEAQLSEKTGDLDTVFQGETPTNKFEISLNPADFDRAKEVMTALNDVTIENISPDYYLFDFTDEELLDVLVNKEEWSELDVVLSEKILNDRKVEINHEDLLEKQKARQAELEKPANNQTLWIAVGYVFAFLGGFMGLIIGYFFWQAKNTLPNGTKVYAYSESDRKNARIIFFISALVFPVSLVWRVFGEIN